MPEDEEEGEYEPEKGAEKRIIEKAEKETKGNKNQK